MNHVLLYVEDNDNNIFLVQSLLRRRPQIEMLVAMNGRDGVQAAIDKRPGLILSTTACPTQPAAKSCGTSVPRRPRPRSP